MVPQLGAVAEEYSVPVYSTGGFSSLTAISLISERAIRRETATVLLHVEDFDPSGESVFSAMVEDAAAFVEADRVILPQRIVPKRVALTEDQVNDYDLPTSPPKKSDSRSASWIGETCQLEALAPDDLASIVREEIECVMDADKLAHEIEAERADRLELGRALPRGGGT